MKKRQVKKDPKYAYLYDDGKKVHNLGSFNSHEEGERAMERFQAKQRQRNPYGIDVNFGRNLL